MTNVLKKLAFPMVFCGVLWMGSSAEAQQADIVSISTTPGLEGSTLVSAGSKIEIKIGMFGNFGMTNASPGPFTLPQLRMVVNGGNSAFAQMESYAPSYYPASFRTYFTFFYTVKPGDMASPLKIYGIPGSSTAGDKYDIINNGYAFYNKSNSSNLVWRFNTTAGGAGDVYDLDFAMVAKRHIKTLSFEDAHSPVTVPATESTTWRVTTLNPVEGNVVDFYVWPANTNLVRVGSVPGQTALLVSIPVGATFADFPIAGLSTGATEIVLQRVIDYNNNATLGVTNYITRPITVTAPPEPTVKVMLAGSDNVTLNESSALSTGALTVELSQAFAQDVWVRLTTMPAVQNNLTLVPYPNIVRVPAGSLASSTVYFSLPDGTVTSLLSGIVISPEVTNTAAASVFTRMKSGTVYVRNVKPLIQQPLATDTPTATRGESFAFAWTVSDVPADVASGMTLTWNFGDGTANEIVSNAAGSVNHIYTTPSIGTGTKTVKVTAKDKDGTV
ncbi:MAG: PKD domain-containing protein, partial [bacterium]